MRSNILVVSVSICINDILFRESSLEPRHSRFLPTSLLSCQGTWVCIKDFNPSGVELCVG